MAQHRQTLLFGVAGGSGCGKTHLARRVCELAGQDQVAVISMDQYFRSSGHEESGDINFDHPNHLDLDLLTHHLAELKAGRSVETPLYNFAQRKRLAEVKKVAPVSVVVVEGLFVLSSPVLDCLDMTCFLDVADDQRLLGRILRDVSEREHDVETIVERYQRFVRPSYHVFVAPSRQNADIVVDFTYKRALFARLLAHVALDYANGSLDLPALLQELRSEHYTLGYRADESIMPIAIDIRRLAEAYPEHAFPKSAKPDHGSGKLYLSGSSS